MKTGGASWYRVANIAEVDSPALLVYPERVEENLRRMVAIAGGVERLRPHIKTHKLPEILRLHQALGITKFKCATIGEAEMAGQCGAPDVLLAFQPVGPKARRLLQLAEKFSETKFSAIVDDDRAIRALAETVELYRLIAAQPGLKAGGLHAYDGHLRDSDPARRTKACEAAFAPLDSLRHELAQAGLPVPRVVVGGTPTFPMHARRLAVECSPGTCVFWDYGYATRLPDLDFLPAALVLTRVISKPGANRLCLDLGHKAIAAENPHPRVHLLDMPDAKFATHSEEHLVVETPRAGEFAVGDVLYGIPWHICPTVALYSEAVVVKNGQAERRWKVLGRERRITV
jgi:D-serine deaminase-like pyridoxal phosphate-dependent protein